MKSVLILSDRKLDLAALLIRYRDAWNIYLQSPYLTVVSEEGPWFCLDIAGGQDLLQAWSVKQTVQVRALIGQPVTAILEYENPHDQERDDPRMLSLALSRLPTDRVFVVNDHNVIFAAKEIQRRLQTGEDWKNVGKEAS